MDTPSIENVQSGKNLEGHHAEINKVISGLTKLNKIIIIFFFFLMRVDQILP